MGCDAVERIEWYVPPDTNQTQHLAPSVGRAEGRMMNNICLDLDKCGVKLEQNTHTKLFTVTYGKQIKHRLDYIDAATELGCCIMHALACDSLLDNSGEEL
jgi:hypothetical protein